MVASVKSEEATEPAYDVATKGTAKKKSTKSNRLVASIKSDEEMESKNNTLATKGTAKRDSDESVKATVIPKSDEVGVEEQPASNKSSGDEEDNVVVSLPHRGQEIDWTDRDHWVSAFERAVDIEVPKRGPNGRPKQIKKGFLKN